MERCEEFPPFLYFAGIQPKTLRPRTIKIYFDAFFLKTAEDAKGAKKK